ncbi:uncharacterized protein LOC120726734 [Simochromis diagramma]|uniref:uncharacterized protein LOC120726734 n=1 Tax=Simochromis diagramma TaxID=43689 RepID=UPI001A7EFA49|nr:uncharacterized protein LOC120726734 [Simochromis diagramma]
MRCLCGRGRKETLSCPFLECFNHHHISLFCRRLTTVSKNRLSTKIDSDIFGDTKTAKMAGLWWITVTMLFSLSAGKLAEINQNQLATLIYHLTRTVRHEYNVYSMYAVAASIPKDESRVSYDLRRVTDTNQRIQFNDGILRTSRFVVAPIKYITNNNGVYLYTQHAEWRLLQNLNLEGQDGDLLVFFSYATPCLTSCANPNGNYKITDSLQKLFNKHKWGEKAFVFEAIFRPGGMNIDSDEKRDEIKRSTTKALTNIANSIGSENIFRCYRPDNHDYICIKCFNGGKIVENCIS